MLNYSLINGSLPNGVTLDGNTGLLLGQLDYTSVDQGPIWVTTSGSLGTFTALSNVTIPALQVNPGSDNTSITGISLMIKNGSQGIPWGLTFDPSSGVISGTLAEQKTNDPTNEFTADQLPTWVTPSGSLLTTGEFKSVSLQLSVSAITNHSISTYTCIKGGLPWGLILGSNGAISGTTAELKQGDLSEYSSPVPIPTWNTPAGLLLNTFNLRSVSTSISATANLGTTVSYSCISGALPWGLMLSSNGTISGTSAELKNYEKPVVTSPPIWNVSSNVIGTYGISTQDSVSYQVPVASATADGATITGYFAQQIKGYAMPLGLSLSSSGTISGKIAKTNIPGTYQVNIGALDSNGQSTIQQFQITLTA